MADSPSQRPEDQNSLSLSRRELLMGAGGVLLAGSLAACGGGSSSTSPTTSGAAGTPKRGGNFRLAVTGGGAKDIMDGQTIITKPDQARLMTAFETLVVYDTNYVLHPHLAEEVTQNKPDQWTIVLKNGIEFSKTVGVLYFNLLTFCEDFLPLTLNLAMPQGLTVQTVASSDRPDLSKPKYVVAMVGPIVAK